ncbi:MULTISPECIES: DUF4333 domain-containing protein [Mycolicibacterium]|uniref:DUF4333 domain-containing protein n=1 Tax=Mycolicibacterium mageritense TaxID=53462 RepID=A0ABM7HK68_MYCME|nr:DUF4333 domain-containing protein [Mycolicibacterium mageritense]MBN3454213.1 DUF4333 domain-containing protein [Mycobacterium sp. DSM 3803]MCC9182400.1 DUF4333 domain-containing protein [Mycolicibacterium mageritense]BBX30878.1 hypothetical protein MMAGJ_01600 [Mycolicibacterium mageritense]CDO23932.1 hypothetical protein BN978_04424 [Mycolicibacterium mageritense DSM 44476 = CIP 104973]
MTDPQPWWARPGGASPAPGDTPGQPAQPSRGDGPYWNPNPPSAPPAQHNPYGAPQRSYGSPTPAQTPWQGGSNQPGTANPFQAQGYSGSQPYPSQPEQPYQGYGGTPQKPKSSSKWLLIGGLAVVAVLIVGGGLLAWSLMGSGKELDVKQAEAGVQEILSDPINGYGSNDVTAVTCNDGKNPEVETNKSFTCQVEINGTTRNVNVEFTDDEGTYAVDGPR